MFNAINYHLVGFAYAGKSTFAKELEAKHGFARISIDDIKWRLGLRDTSDDDSPILLWVEPVSLCSLATGSRLNRP
jgi:hypothetical protein